MRTLSIVLGAALVLGGCSSDQPAAVSYAKDVKPVLDKHCLMCHDAGGKGAEKAGLRMDSYAGLMKGTKFGPIVNPGSSLDSVLNQVVEGRVDKSIRMPHGGKSLSKAEQDVLKRWVDQGARNN